MELVVGRLAKHQDVIFLFVLLNQYHILDRPHLAFPLESQNVHTVLLVPLRLLGNQPNDRASVSITDITVLLFQGFFVFAGGFRGCGYFEINLNFAIVG